MTGRPDSNNAASAMISSTALVSGSACPTMDRSKRRAMWPNCSPTPAKLALSVSGSAATPARALAAVKRSSAALRRRFVLALLGLDHLGRNISGARNRNDRIVEKSDSGEVGVERRGDGNCIVAGRARLFADAKIDDDVLDHLARPSVASNINNSISHTRRRRHLRQIKDAGVRLFFDIALGIELLEVSPKVVDVLLVLDAGEESFWCSGILACGS